MVEKIEKATIGFNVLWSLLGGIFFFIAGVLLADTAIFAAVNNLPAIALFLGGVAGGFKEKLNLNLF